MKHIEIDIKVKIKIDAYNRAFCGSGMDKNGDHFCHGLATSNGKPACRVFQSKTVKNNKRMERLIKSDIIEHKTYRCQQCLDAERLGE